MGLEAYWKKRNFNNTPEPEGVVVHSGRQRFVIQRHQASRLHYDLRLEMDGVLKSWAIPKGPSLNPDDKRLAVQTEDHPIKYLDFEGDIPKGNYGAGRMKIWDSGTYEFLEPAGEGEALEQLSAGQLKLQFHGNRIKGTFVLVRTYSNETQDHWLLIKKSDAFATNAPYDAELIVPETGGNSQAILDPISFIEPMLASPAREIFNDPDWIYEIKWDGYRLMGHKSDSGVQLYSRNGRDYTQKFQVLCDELNSLPHTLILDGEAVVLDKEGNANFTGLQNYPGNYENSLRYYVFDMLYLNGHSMLELPLKDRKSLLPELLEGLNHCMYCDHIVAMGASLYKQVTAAGLEGVVAKRADSVYVPGLRTENWLKIKKDKTLEAFICGYTKTSGNRSDFGSLILGRYQHGQLLYSGNCGSGFSMDQKLELLQLFEPLETRTMPFTKNPDLKGRKPQWLLPQLQCEVKYSTITKNGLLRHPVFLRLRQDLSTTAREGSSTSPMKESTTKAQTLDVQGRSVAVSNLEKVFWPSSGLRKYDLIDYYIKVSDFILPYLKDRPQNLHRHPNGILDAGFYQKDGEGFPDWIPTKAIYSESSRREISYLLCQDQATLLYLANLGCIELNPWNSRIQHLQWPDYTVIDLDPSPANTLEQVREVGLACKEVLDIGGITGYCKTSGSRGLHIYIPQGAQYTYEESRSFTRLLCHYVNEKLPGLTTMERKISNRGHKIYLDYLQNRYGQTLAAAYCVRPKPGAPVSTPLGWEEVGKGFEMADFNISSVPERLQQTGDLFSGLLADTLDMAASLDKLDNHFNGTENP